MTGLTFPERGGRRHRKRRETEEPIELAPLARGFLRIGHTRW